MPNQAELLKKVIQSPDSNALRYELADLLLSQGNPQGQVMRWQCELEALTQADRGWYSRSYQLSNLLRGTNPIIGLMSGESIEAQITRELSAIQVDGKNVGSSTVRRGFVEAYSVFDIAKLKSRESDVISAAPLITALEFQELTTHEHFDDLVRLQMLPRIKSLTFKECTFSERDFDSLFNSQTLASLKQLTLYKCRFEGGIELLAMSQIAPHIERLAITITREQAQDLQAGNYLGNLLTDDHFPQLRSLELIHACTPSDLDRLAQWRGLSKLRELELRGLDWPTDQAAKITQMDLSSLEALNLSGIRGKPSQVSLATCPSLRVLILKGLTLDEVCMKSLSESISPALQQMTLSSCNLTSSTVEHWLHGLPASGLKFLNLQDNQLDIDCIRTLAVTPWLASLISLKLSFNPLGDECGSVLANSPVLNQLAFLDLSETGLGDRSARAIFSSQQFNSLEWLNLDGNSITVESLPELLNPKYLQNIIALRLKNTEIWEEHKSDCINRFGTEVVDSYWLGYLI